MQNKIRILVLDVDGTLTDGKIYMGETGEIFKAFDVKDGCGLKDILPQYNITPVVITARKSKIVENRCSELGIAHVYQGVRNKYEKMCQVLEKISCVEGESYTLSNVAYIGDDILDLQCMSPVKMEGGIIGCPKDAIQDIKDISEFISARNGGNGAVREFIEYLVGN